jgi:predicted transcriptional regulator
MSAFDDLYHNKTGLSTISTYLGRLYRDGYLEREGNRVSLRYRLTGKTKISRLQEQE